MRMYENDEENGLSGDRAEYNLILTPTNASVEDVVNALNDINFYGRYISSIRSDKAALQKAIEDHFGPSIPTRKKPLEKLRGKPFPPKTKQAIDDFIKEYNPKPNLFKYSVSGDKLIFPKQGNPTVKTTKDILSVVLNNADIEYNIEEKENIGENLYKLKQVIKEEIRRELNK